MEFNSLFYGISNAVFAIIGFIMGIFPTREMANDFLECFRYLIEQARDLI